jgi:transposase
MRDMVFTRENFDQLLDERTGLRSEIDQLKTETRLLQEKVQFLMKKLFGRSSERLNPDQLQLALEDLRGLQEALELAETQVDEAEETQEKKESKRGRRKPLDAKIPEDLPTEVIVIEPDEVMENPELWEKIGEERSEQLDVTPTRFFKTVTIRNKYKKIADRSVAPVIAPAPKRLIENSYASAGLILHIILSKYCDHLPLYRQEQIFKQRYGVEISRKTMGGWMHLMANWLSLIYEALRNEIRASGYIQADETFIPYQDPKKDHCPTGYLWTYHSPRVGVLFEWYPSRAAECLDSMLSGYQGLLQSDGYGAYSSWLKNPAHAKEKSQILHAACWAHARRKFVEASHPVAVDIVVLIAKLYRIESKLRKQDSDNRCATRQAHAAPILKKIKAILEAEQPRTLPKSAFGKAINYTLKRWEMLNEYLDHDALEIDNNLVENAIRPTAIGKKNWLFFGSPDSGQDSAILYSLIETCRKLDINPADYLRELFDALPSMEQKEVENWTPAKWEAAREVQPTPEFV